MSEEWALFVIPASAVLFYLLIPAIGAFRVRHRWRVFRASLIRSIALPRLDGDSIRRILDNGGVADDYWFLGRLESVGKGDVVWLEREGVSVGLDLGNTPVVLLPTPAQVGGELPDETPQIVYWHEIAALVEGTRFFVSGRVRTTDGTVCFSGHDDRHPFVIVYDGPDDTLVARALWTGRQRNEYWNHLTPGSLVGGFLALLLLAIIALDVSRLISLIALVLATVPILPLLPPGVVGFFVYRRIWRRARRVRARRDLIGLPESINSGTSTPLYERREGVIDEKAVTIALYELPQGEEGTLQTWIPRGEASDILPRLRRPPVEAADITALNRTAYTLELAGIALFVTGVAVNAYLAAVFLVLLLT